MEITGAALAAVWLAAFVAIDVVFPSTAVFSVFFAVSPLIGCALLPPRSTAVFAALAAVLTVASGWWNTAFASAQHYIRVADVVTVSAVAVFISAVRVRREQRLARIIAIAEAAQRAVLPTLPPRI